MGLDKCIMNDMYPPRQWHRVASSKNPLCFSYSSLPPPPHPLANTDLFTVSLGLPFYRMSYSWNWWTVFDLQQSQPNAFGGDFQLQGLGLRVFRLILCKPQIPGNWNLDSLQFSGWWWFCWSLGWASERHEKKHHREGVRVSDTSGWAAQMGDLAEVCVQAVWIDSLLSF